MTNPTPVRAATDELVNASYDLINGWSDPFDEVDEQGRSLYQLEVQNAMTRLLAAAEQVRAAQTAPQEPAPFVNWPEPKWLPRPSGAAMNPQRVDGLFDAIKQELVAGEMLRLMERLWDEFEGDLKHPDRDALVEAIDQANIEWCNRSDGRQSRSEHIADSLIGKFRGALVYANAAGLSEGDADPNLAAGPICASGRFPIKTIECQWQVVVQPVDQYGKSQGEATVLSRWATREEAVADRPNHGIEHQFRWVPHGSAGYENLEVVYREVPVVAPDSGHAALVEAIYEAMDFDQDDSRAMADDIACDLIARGYCVPVLKEDQAPLETAHLKAQKDMRKRAAAEASACAAEWREDAEEAPKDETARYFENRANAGDWVAGKIRNLPLECLNGETEDPEPTWREFVDAPMDGTAILMDEGDFSVSVRWENHDEAAAAASGTPGYWRYCDETLSDVCPGGPEVPFRWMPDPAAA